MKDKELKTSEEWSETHSEIIIIDADGWDRKNFDQSWTELITEDEFNLRVCYSTIQIKKI